MKATVSLLSIVTLASTLFLASTALLADELVVKEAATLDFHCHQHFPATYPNRSYWNHGGYDETVSAVSDFYGPCDHELTRPEEIGLQRRNLIDKEAE